MMKGLILVAHGSRRETSNREFLTIVEQVRKQKDLDFARIEAAFLEFSERTIDKAVEAMVDADVENLFVYPYFLNAGNHVVNDIPQKVKAMEQTYPNIKVTVLPYIGSSASIISVIADELGGVL